MLLEQRKDGPHPVSFFFVHYQTAAPGIYVIAEHRTSAHPFSLSPRSRHLVARSLADQLPLELSKRKQDVQRQPSERCAGVELLGDRNETHFVFLEDA